MRAPTPTAAAEMAVPVRMDLVGQVMVAGSRLVEAMARGIAERRVRLDGFARALPRPIRIIEETRQRLDDWSERLGKQPVGRVDLRQRRLAQAAGRLKFQSRGSSTRPAGSKRRRARFRPRSARRFANAGPGARRRRGRSGSLSYQRVLERGFALVHGPDGEPISRAGQAKPGMNIGLEFSDGAVGATVEGAPSPRKPRRRPSKAPDGTQGSLL